MQAAVIGVPGTGKSYFMCHYLKKYFVYDDFFREYTINKDVLIITNIEGLKFYGSSCWNLESPEILGKPSEGIEGKYERDTFFTVKNFENIMLKTGKKNIILVIDEAQKDYYFPLGYKVAEVLFLFAYHRHIGMDIILGSQDASLLSRGVLAQCEYLAHGTPRSKKIFGAMSYTFTDNKGHYMYSKTLRTDKSVFAAYQSASVDEVNKPKNAILHWFVVGFVLLIVGGGLFKSALAMINKKSHPVHPAVVSVVPAKTGVPASSGSVSPGAAPGQAVFHNNSTLRVMPVITPVAIWREYQVEAYIRDGGRYHYMIDGNFVDSVRCRNYNNHLHTVEYYSLEPLTGRRAVSVVPLTAPLSGLPAALPAKVEPLGATSAYTPLNAVSTPEYVPVTNAGKVFR